MYSISIDLRKDIIFLYFKLIKAEYAFVYTQKLLRSVCLIKQAQTGV